MTSLYCLLLMTSCLVLLMSSSMASSDPVTSLCDPICWEEEAIADECVQDRCYRKRKRLRVYQNCENRCWRVVTPCRRLCHRHSFSTLMRCQRKCDPLVKSHPGRNRDCQWHCFTHIMMGIKARILPQDYIGFQFKPK